MMSDIEKIRRQILEILYDHEKKDPLGYLDRKILKEKSNLEDNQLDFHVLYLEEKNYVELLKGLGSRFEMARITSYGTDIIEEPSEDVQKRRQIEKISTETERSWAVVREKLAHAKIEEVERMRRARAVTSLMERIVSHEEDIVKLVKVLLELTHKESMDKDMMHLINSTFVNCKSIWEDFKEITKMQEEKMQKMFPHIETKFENYIQAAGVLHIILTQERQMLAYLQRLLP